MKKVTLILGALALVLGLSQCRKPNAPTINGIGETQHIIIKANNGNDGSKVNVEAAGAALNLTWEGTDIITVSGGATGTLTHKSGTGATATFEGDITRTAGEEVLFSTGVNTVSYADQAGTTAWIKSDIRLEGTSEYKSDGNYGTIDMKLTYAVLKLDISAFGTATPGTTVTISVGSTVVASVNGVTNAADNPYYVAMPAADRREYTFSGNGQIAKVTWKLDKNTYYTKTDGHEGSTGDAIVIAPPTVVTIPVCARHSTCASSGGVVTGTGVDEQGVCWGTSENPTVSDNKYVHNEYATNSLTPKNETINNTFTGFMSGLTSGATYHVRAYVKTCDQVVYGNDIEFTTKTTAEEPVVTGVDLGLPSGRIWATCNMGAANEYDYGDYYMWGDNAACSTISSGTTYYVSCGDQSDRYVANSWRKYTKYCPSDKTDYWYGGAGTPDNKLVLDNADDCVQQTLGDGWRMPTTADWQELFDNTEKEPIMSKGVSGWRFTSTKTGYTDKSIFLPAAGYRGGTSLNSVSIYGLYWSNSLYLSLPYCAYYLHFDANYVAANNYANRYYGFPVRPVK